MSNFDKLISLIKNEAPGLSFKMLEVGARSLGKTEPFHKLIESFPNSICYGFEADAEACKEVNDETPDCFQYFPVALGEKNETRPFYITEHGMCSSLYKPNEALQAPYNALSQFNKLKETIEIETSSLNTFAGEKGISDIDFIKIDVQGAELDIFKGGTDLLDSVFCIVSEVEFVHLYEDQPLFGDVSNFLAQYDLMFHKFIGIGTRNIAPITINNNPGIGTQSLWSDAMYIQHITKLKALDNDQLLKLALLAHTYESIDLAYHCLSLYSRKNSSDLDKEYQTILMGK